MFLISLALASSVGVAGTADLKACAETVNAFQESAKAKDETIKALRAEIRRLKLERDRAVQAGNKVVPLSFSFSPTFPPSLLDK